MKKEKNTLIECEFNFATVSYSIVSLTVLTNMLQKSLKALKEYTDMPTPYESLPEILKGKDLVTAVNDLVQRMNNIKKIDIYSLDKKTIKGIFDFILSFENIKIQDKGIFFTGASCCNLLGLLYCSTNQLTNEEKRYLKPLEDMVKRKLYEAIGYWTAKLEIMKQNQKNVKKRTTKKEDRKTELKEWMKSMKPNEYRLKAMQKWDVSERTVLNYLKEMNFERENNGKN